MSILDDLQSVADAIRSKTGKTDKMMLAEMPGEIEGITGGGEITKYNISGFKLPQYGLSLTDNFEMLNMNNNAVRPLCSIDYSKPWEVEMRFTPSYSSPQDMTLTGTYEANYKNPSYQLKLMEKRLWCGYSTSGATWDYQISVPLDASDFSSGTTYIGVFGWNGTTFYAKTLDENRNILLSGELEVTQQHYQDENYPFVFGRNVASNIYYVGDIDFSKTYIKNDGKIVWGCQKDNSVDSYPKSPLSIYVYPVIAFEAPRPARTYPGYETELYLTD